MAWTYSYGSNPAIDYVRLLIADTNILQPVFQDEEITVFSALQAGAFQSSAFYSGAGGASLPASPVSYLRVAALALDTLATNKAKLAGVRKLLDVDLDLSAAAKALRDQAAVYRAQDDDSGAFAIIEQCSTTWAFQDRWWKQVQRQSAQ